MELVHIVQLHRDKGSHVSASHATAEAFLLDSDVVLVVLRSCARHQIGGLSGYCHGHMLVRTDECCIIPADDDCAERCRE